jgi:hypothetical protein
MPAPRIRAWLAAAAVAGVLAVAPGCSMLMNGWRSTEEISLTSAPPGMTVRIERMAEAPADAVSGAPAGAASDAPSEDASSAAPSDAPTATARDTEHVTEPALPPGTELRTPCRVVLPKGATYVVTFSGPGYRSAVAYIGTEPSPWYYANALVPFGVVLLMPIDNALGTDTILVPQELSMRMDRVDAPAMASELRMPPRAPR